MPLALEILRCAGIEIHLRSFSRAVSEETVVKNFFHASLSLPKVALTIS